MSHTGIPDLSLDRLTAYFNGPGGKLDAQGTFRVEIKIIASESRKY